MRVWKLFDLKNRKSKRPRSSENELTISFVLKVYKNVFKMYYTFLNIPLQIHLEIFIELLLLLNKLLLISTPFELFEVET